VEIAAPSQRIKNSAALAALFSFGEALGAY
jgi:hypothetical protein